MSSLIKIVPIIVIFTLGCQAFQKEEKPTPTPPPTTKVEESLVEKITFIIENWADASGFTIDDSTSDRRVVKYTVVRAGTTRKINVDVKAYPVGKKMAFRVRIRITKKGEREDVLEELEINTTENQKRLLRQIEKTLNGID